MEVDGILFALLDIPREQTEEYNRWYDLDHMPEHVSKADVLTAKRYVAPRDLQELGGGGSTLTGGHPPYLTIYSLGGDDFAGDEAWAGWTTKDRGHHQGGALLAERCARVRPPHATGRGVHPGVGAGERRGGPVPRAPRRRRRARSQPSAEQRDDAVRWWRETHLVDLLALEGVLAAMRFESIQDDESDLLLHVFLLEDDPAVVMERFAAALRYSTPLGRYPADGGVYESIAMLPYRLIAPLEYDFEW